MPFTFNTKEEKKEETSLDSLMSGGNKSLEMMAGLGLPADLPPDPIVPSAGAGGDWQEEDRLSLLEERRDWGWGGQRHGEAKSLEKNNYNLLQYCLLYCKTFVYECHTRHLFFILLYKL